MLTIMADNDVENHVSILINILGTEPWREVTLDLDIRVQTFETLGLPRNAADETLWQTCQAHNVVLITGNRNDDGPDSLEAAIRTSNQVSSLPVFTIANRQRITSDKEYAHRTAAKLLEYLFDLGKYHGTGRLYIP